MDETTNSNWAPWDDVKPNVTSPQGEQTKIFHPEGTSIEQPGLVSDFGSQVKVGKPSRPSTSAKIRLIYGADLNSNPRFSNAIDGKKINDPEMYFQVTPYAFARRSMMRTATVRTLLLERKLPRLIDSHDNLMVIVTMDWVTGRTNPQNLEELGFNPEDYFDAE